MVSMLKVTWHLDDAFYQSLPRVVGPYTLSNLCQRLYAKMQNPFIKG
jgi:hypothetical protein